MPKKAGDSEAVERLSAELDGSRELDGSVEKEIKRGKRRSRQKTQRPAQKQTMEDPGLVPQASSPPECCCSSGRKLWRYAGHSYLFHPAERRVCLFRLWVLIPWFPVHPFLQRLLLEAVTLRVWGDPAEW